MMLRLKQFCAFALGMLTALSVTFFPHTPDTALLQTLFDDLSKISYCTDYTELWDSLKNPAASWRQGMVGGNGRQGFVNAGSPYSDTFIYQNMDFILPNQNVRRCPNTAHELEGVKQSIIAGENIVDNASYDDVYSFHPGAQMRIRMRRKPMRDYVRYTDYETGQVGVHYRDRDGVWDRKTFASMADDVIITEIARSSKGKKVNMTLSVDAISTLAGFGKGSETDLQYKVLVPDRADCICMVAHYPDYAHSELKNGGYATLTYVLTVRGTQERIQTQGAKKEPQYVGDDFPALRITDADAVYLLTASGRTWEMGALADFAERETYALTDALYEKVRAAAERYTTARGFDYTAALQAHLAVYRPQFGAVTLDLENGTSARSNKALLRAQFGRKKLNSALAQRAYYAGRYAYLCCSGHSTSRLYGMWTGEWNPGWGSKYTMDANVNLQTAAMNTGNMSSSPIGYAYFILRQASDWMENALATHGYTDALQAPVNADGDCAAITETCYPYPFRYWNAGASWMLLPLYETLQCYGDLSVPLDDTLDLDALRAVLSVDTEPLSDDALRGIEQRGYLRLREDILYPLLLKSANYWDQLMSAEYYTDKDGAIHYEKGKTTLQNGETYCILPGYSPENNPSNYPSPATANCAIDIAACRSNLEMLLCVMRDADPNADSTKWQTLLHALPPYLYDASGALKEWATTAFTENNEHRHLSHLYGAWPLFETQNDATLAAACKQAIRNRRSENEASHALIHRSLIAARLKDRDSFTDALCKLMNHRIHYGSLMTNHDYDRGSCYCTDFAIGYPGMIHESLVYSDDGQIEVLPCLPTSGFAKGKLCGVRARTRATVNLLQWDITDCVVVQITADVAQTIRVSCPLSADATQTLHFDAGETKTVRFSLA